MKEGLERSSSDMATSTQTLTNLYSVMYHVILLFFLFPPPFLATTRHEGTACVGGEKMGGSLAGLGFAMQTSHPAERGQRNTGKEPAVSRPSQSSFFRLSVIIRCP